MQMTSVLRLSLNSTSLFFNYKKIRTALFFFLLGILIRTCRGVKERRRGGEEEGKGDRSVQKLAAKLDHFFFWLGLENLILALCVFFVLFLRAISLSSSSRARL